MAEKSSEKPFRCEIKIDEKPPGNFRPHARIDIDINAADYPKRPYLKGIKLAMPYGHRVQAVENTTNPYWILQYNLIKKGLENGKAQLEQTNIFLPDAIFYSDVPNNDDVLADGKNKLLNKKYLAYVTLSLILSIFFAKISFLAPLILAYFIFTCAVMIVAIDASNLIYTYYLSLDIVPEGYLENDLKVRAEFYLPMRKGENPSYADYAKAFERIPQMLEAQLQDQN